MSETDRLCEKAEALLRAREYVAAFDLLAPLAEAPGAPPRVLWTAGHIARLAGQSRVAIPLLERALERAPAQAVIYEDLALAHAAARQPGLCRAVLRRGADAASAPGPLHALLAAFALDDMDIETARRHLAAEAACGPGDGHAGACALLAIHERDWPAALAAASAALGLPPPFPDDDEDSPAPRRTPSPPAAIPGVALATSLSPRGGDEQRAAMATWRDFAACLISVNAPEEIDILAPAYPDVRFVAAARDGRDVFGRPLIFIDDILDALDATGAALTGIVNADIRLLSADRLSADLRTAGADALTLCHRIDLADAADTTGTPYLMGFDAFFFPRARIADLRGSRLPLGAPWWDYLFPVLALAAGLPVHIPAPAAAGHVVHPLNWSPEAFVAAAGLWMDALAAHGGDAPPIRRFLRPLVESYGTRRRLLGHDPAAPRADVPEREAELGVLATLVNHLIRTQSAPAGAPRR